MPELHLPPAPRHLPWGTRLKLLSTGRDLMRAHVLLALALLFAVFGVGRPGADPSFALLPLGLLLVYLKLAWSAVQARLGQVRLLEHGLAVLTTEVDRFTPPTKKKQPKHRKLTQMVSLRYTVDGRSHSLVIRTKDPTRLLDEAQEQLLVDPQRPSVAVAMGQLPEWLQVDRAGWMDVPGGWILSLLQGVVPLVFVVFVVLWRVLGL